MTLVIIFAMLVVCCSSCLLFSFHLWFYGVSVCVLSPPHIYLRREVSLRVSKETWGERYQITITRADP